ncbi:MAG: hypothetical protein WCX96_05105, partial [Bacilli bacterium]
TIKQIESATQKYLFSNFDNSSIRSGDFIEISLQDLKTKKFLDRTIKNPRNNKNIENSKKVVVENVNGKLIYNVIIDNQITVFDGGKYHIITAGYYNGLYGWGSNENNELSPDGGEYVTTPINIDKDNTYLNNERVIDIASCYANNIVLTESNKVYIWGVNNEGQLGTGNYDAQLTPYNITSSFNGDVIIDVECGEESSFAITEENDLYVWGYNSYGLLGGNDDDEILSPVKATATSGYQQYNLKIKKVAATSESAVYITTDNKVYSIGENVEGQLGNGTTISTDKKVNITSSFDSPITKISAGRDHFIALTENGEIYTWGGNSYGQIGNNTTNNQLIPLKINIEDKLIYTISAGYYHSGVVTTTGEVYMFGNNDYGQLGNNTRINQLTPINISEYFNGEKIKKISLSYRNSYALSYDNNFYAWGRNSEYGAVGNGSDKHQLTPTIINIIK